MGPAIALTLAEQGARLLLTDISAGRLDATVKHLGGAVVDPAGSGAVAVRAHATDRGEAAAVVETVLTRFGRIDRTLSPSRACRR